MAQGTTKGVPIDTDPLLAADSDLLVPSQKAIKTYVDNSNVNQVETSRSISTTAPLAGGGDLSADRTLSITQATASTDGYVSSTDWNTFNNKVDKSQAAYKMLANNTNGTANMTAQAFQDVPSQTYTGVPVFNISAPTGTTNHSYRWTRIGNMVTLNISLVYGTASVNNTNVTIPLPTDCPTPLKPAGMTAASNFLYPVTNATASNLLTTSANVQTRGGLRSNAANNGFEFFINFNSSATLYFQLTCIYYTN
jgi:hypothetical protein